MLMIGKTHIFEKEYEKIVSVNQGGYRPAQGESKYREKNLIQTLKKRKRIVKELVLNNFSNGESYFITLTFSDVKDKRYNNLELCQKEFNKFIRKMRSLYPSLKYVAVYARQLGTDNWHYHLISNQKSIEPENMLKLWPHGSNNIKSVYDVYGISDYLSNNFEITKFASYEAGYKQSKGLDRFAEYRTWNPEESQFCQMVSSALKLQKLQREFYTTSKYCGSYVYREYLIQH